MQNVPSMYHCEPKIVVPIHHLILAMDENNKPTYTPAEIVSHPGKIIVLEFAKNFVSKMSRHEIKAYLDAAHFIGARPYFPYTDGCINQGWELTDSEGTYLIFIPPR